MSTTEQISRESFTDTSKFFTLRSLEVEVNSPTEIKNLLEVFKPIEFEKMEQISENKYCFDFFDYTTLYMGLEALKDDKSFNYQIKEKEQNKIITNAYFAGCSRHIFVQDRIQGLSAEDTEQTKKTLETYYGVKNIQQIIFNADKKVFHFKFFDIQDSLKFAFKLKKENKRFGFQRRKADGIFFNLRTVYLGNITDEITDKDIEGCLMGGRLFSIKFLRNKFCAFALFINPWSAEAFIKYCEAFPLYIKNKNIKVTPANPGNILLSGILSVAEGCTRIIKFKRFRGDKIAIDGLDYVFGSYYDEEDLIVNCHSVQEAETLSNRGVQCDSHEFLDDPAENVNFNDLMIAIDQKLME